VYNPYLEQEGRKFITEVKSNVDDNDFKLKGQLKESFSTIIDKYPIIRNGHKGPEMTISLRKMLENTKFDKSCY